MKHKHRVLSRATAAAMATLLVAQSDMAPAQTQAANLNVTATNLSACSVVGTTAAELDFGTYNPGDFVTPVSTTISVTCNAVQQSIRFCFDGGQNPFVHDTLFGFLDLWRRRMTRTGGGTQTLAYTLDVAVGPNNVVQPDVDTPVPGDACGTFFGAADVSAVSADVTAKLVPDQLPSDIPQGTYLDTITVLIEFE